MMLHQPPLTVIITIIITIIANSYLAFIMHQTPLYNVLIHHSSARRKAILLSLFTNRGLVTLKSFLQTAQTWCSGAGMYTYVSQF